MLAYKPNWPRYNGDYITRGYIEPDKEMGLSVNRAFKTQQEAINAIKDLKAEHGDINDYRILPMQTFVQHLNNRPRERLDKFLKELTKPKSKPTQ